MSDIEEQRKYYERMMDEVDTEYRRRIADLQAENAKLRKLVKAARRCIHTGVGCSDCRLIAGGCTLQTAMGELGVEV